MSLRTARLSQPSPSYPASARDGPADLHTAATAPGLAAIEKDGGGPRHGDQRRPNPVRRPISVPLTPVTGVSHGHSRIARPAGQAARPAWSVQIPKLIVPGRQDWGVGSRHAGGNVGGLPRTRRRSIHASRNLSRAPSASLRDRLRRPWTEPVCRQVRQQSGSGEGSGQGQARSPGRQKSDGGDEARRKGSGHRCAINVPLATVSSGKLRCPTVGQIGRSYSETGLY